MFPVRWDGVFEYFTKIYFSTIPSIYCTLKTHTGSLRASQSKKIYYLKVSLEQNAPVIRALAVDDFTVAVCEFGHSPETSEGEKAL